MTKILLVDDTSDNLEILKLYLEDDYELETAMSGEEALEKLPQFQPDLILLDVMMPGMNGLDTCRCIRSLPHTDHIKILFLSAKAGAADRELGLDAGGNDYLAKPFEEDDLIAAVRVQVASAAL